MDDHLFKNLSFVILEYSIEVTKKRSEILKSVIEKNGGRVLNLGAFRKKIEKVDFALTGQNISFSKAKDYLTERDIDEIIFLRVDYITECLKIGKLLDWREYQIRILEPEVKQLIEGLGDKNFNRIELGNCTEEDSKDVKPKSKFEILNDVRNPDRIDFLLDIKENNHESSAGGSQGEKTELKAQKEEFKQDFKPLALSNNELFKMILKEKTRNDKDTDSIMSELVSQYTDSLELPVKSVYSFNEESSNASIFESSLASKGMNKRSKRKIDPKSFAFNNASKESKNMNSHITAELEKMLDYHVNESNTFESLAYRKAISIIKNFNSEITSISQINGIQGLGKQIKSKIKEIIQTGGLKKSEYLSKDKKNKILKVLMKVHGIGFSMANRLYYRNIHSIDQLRENQHLLNTVQKKGLLYYEELTQRIPRDECEEFLSMIKENLYSILPQEVLEVTLCGSYRRGKPTCGDMDVLITRRDEGKIDGILNTLVEKLLEKKVIIEVLSLNLNSIESYSFMGIAKTRILSRRLDIKVYCKGFYPFAILYFTGSAYFNRSMRLFSRKIGFSLSDKGLTPNDLVKLSKEKIEESKNCQSEEDIFKVLGIDYIAPQNRDI